MERVDPMLEMVSSTGVAPPSSPNAMAVGLWDAQQLQVMSLINPINPLLLASACVGCSAALDFLFRREDNHEPPMVIPTQDFLYLLEGYTTAGSTGRSETSSDVEDGVDQPAFLRASWLLRGVTADGVTALHAVASHGDSTEFLKCASIIGKRDQDLLFAVNKKGDTPLHCAARSGKSRMVSRLIELAESCDRLRELLRKENGLKETALHDAVRSGRKDTVESLMEADPELANYPKEGTSPLYLAVLLEKNTIARTLHDKSNGNLSYSGPNGRNALHAAIGQKSGITEFMLRCNSGLTSDGDRHGNTPLHLASSFGNKYSSFFRQLFEANPTLVYRADNEGLYPIHIAASVGGHNVLNIILKKFPSCAGLCTPQGQTFLHVAVKKKRSNVVSFVCRTPSLAWILNMQDNDGNTAMHLAVKGSSHRIFCCLYGNTAVHLNLANNSDETPADLSTNYLPRGMNYSWDTERLIHMALRLVGDNQSGLRLDKYEEMYSRQLKQGDEVKEEEKMKDSSQVVGIGSVLIATMAFSATFAIPGGFIADDHTNRGTPTLAGRYTFDAFMMSNALAFICSSAATMGIMFSGSAMLNLKSRQINFLISEFLMSSSVTCLSASFALGVYMMLAPVAQSTAIAICVLSPIVRLHRNFQFLRMMSILARPICLRTETIRGLKWL